MPSEKIIKSFLCVILNIWIFLSNILIHWLTVWCQPQAPPSWGMQKLPDMEDGVSRYAYLSESVCPKVSFAPPGTRRHGAVRGCGGRAGGGKMIFYFIVMMEASGGVKKFRAIGVSLPWQRHTNEGSGTSVGGGWALFARWLSHEISVD